jgi:hypothetical protein
MNDPGAECRSRSGGQEALDASLPRSEGGIVKTIPEPDFFMRRAPGGTAALKSRFASASFPAPASKISVDSSCNHARFLCAA